MSWIRSGGTFGKRGQGYDDFRNWLKSLGLSDEEIGYIMEMAMNGKLELEVSVIEFIIFNTKNHSEEEEA